MFLLLLLLLLIRKIRAEEFRNLGWVYRHVTAFNIRYWDRISSRALKILWYSSNSVSDFTLFKRSSVRFIAISSLVPATRNSLFNTVAAMSEQCLFKKDQQLNKITMSK